MKIGMLTSGGDCPGLNAVMRAFAKYVCSHIEDVKIFGFLNGYTGLIENEYAISSPFSSREEPCSAASASPLSR